MRLPGYIEVHDAQTGKPILVHAGTVRGLREREPLPTHGLPEPFRHIDVELGGSLTRSQNVYLVRETYHEVKLALDIALKELGEPAP